MKIMKWIAVGVVYVALYAISAFVGFRVVPKLLEM